MLIVFNLDWQRFNIDRQVSAANRKINALAEEKKAGHFIIFNLASLGAGERIIDRVARQHDQTPVAEAGRPDPRAIDYLRRRHWRIARDLQKDNNFKAYRDAAEMLAGLKSRGHRLAAVFTGASAVAEQALKWARALDYFEDRVYGYDSLKSRRDDLTSKGIYLQALKENKTAPADSIIVADSPEAIEESVVLKPMAVAGYLDPYLKDTEIDRRLAEMRQAGAGYAVVGGHSVSSLPDYLWGRRRLQSTLDVITGMGGPAPM